MIDIRESKKGEHVTFTYRGFAVEGTVKRVLKNGTRTVLLTKAEPGFEKVMCQTIEEGIWVDA